MEGLSAVFLVGLPASGGLARRFYGGVADCPAGHIMAASFIGVKIHSDSLLQLPDLIYKAYVPSSYIETSFFNTYLLMPGTLTPFTRIPKCIGLLESVFRAIVNR